ncbi:MAG: response regulator [Persicimonas sp.]
MSKWPSGFDDSEKIVTTSILVVDDEPGVLRVCRRLLEREGHDVHTVERAREALDFFEDGARVDLLLCDVYMPKMSGDELVAQVRELRPRLPVVFISGHLLESQATRQLNVGDDISFLKKPFMGDELLAAVDDALSELA